MSPLQAATITPARRVRGRLRVPGDKSISHRYAILGALAEGPSTFANFASGTDCASTLACLRALGVEIALAREGSAGAVTLMGRGLAGLRSAAGALDAGNSGTTMRLMAGVLAGHPFSSTIVGDPSLSQRPMRRVIAPLESMGARIESSGGHAPLVVHGGRLHAISYRPEAPSAQVKSAVLLAGLHAGGTTSVTEPVATRDHTERALTAFGGQVTVERLTVSVGPGQRLHGRTLAVPGDFSSAAFWLIAAAAIPDSRVEIEDVGLNPTRTALLGVLRRFGARVSIVDGGDDQDASAGEPRGTIVVEHDRTEPVTIAPHEVPALIDELPALAALAAYGGTVSVDGAAELRVKESDRIAALVAGFRSLGIDADERPEGFTIHGGSTDGARPSRPRGGGVADARGDHRIAMAFAIAALAAERPSTIAGAEAVDISYPGFFETLDRLIR